jgi:RNA polymerase sigma-70 factor (ECF subfamily)
MRTDAELIAAVLAGRREAFADLVSRYENAVHAAAMGVLRDHHGAQDVCQETFVSAFRNLGTLREPSSFGSWILRVARNHALTSVRRQPPEQALDESPEVPTHQGNGHLDARAERLLAAVVELPEHERAAVMLRYFAGHSLEQISKMTGQPVGTVGAQLHRARARLRGLLGEVMP